MLKFGIKLLFVTFFEVIIVSLSPITGFIPPIVILILLIELFISLYFIISALKKLEEKQKQLN